MGALGEKEASINRVIRPKCGLGRAEPWRYGNVLENMRAGESNRRMEL